MKILKFRSLDNQSAMKATFSVAFEVKVGTMPLPVEIMINDCRLFEKNDSKWVALPQRQYEKDGEKRYAPYISCTLLSDLKGFQAAVLEAVEAYQKNPVPQAEVVPF